jgi:hypothetical protein
MLSLNRPAFGAAAGNAAVQADQFWRSVLPTTSAPRWPASSSA